jgi:hypothetical protein
MIDGDYTAENFVNDGQLFHYRTKEGLRTETKTFSGTMPRRSTAFSRRTVTSTIGRASQPRHARLESVLALTCHN